MSAIQNLLETEFGTKVINDNTVDSKDKKTELNVINAKPKIKPAKPDIFVYPRKDKEFCHKLNKSDELDSRNADQILTDILGIVHQVYDANLYKNMCVACLRKLKVETWSESGLPQLLHDEKCKILGLDKKSQQDSR